MKWIKERDALIAQTMAFVQSVTGKRDGFVPPDTPTAAPAVWVETVTVETVAVETLAVDIPPPTAPPRPPVMVSPPRTSSDVRSEMQARIANFRKHQERFEREREEYCAATLTKLRAAIRDASPVHLPKSEAATASQPGRYSQDHTSHRLAAQALSSASVSGRSMCPQEVLRSVVMTENIR